MRCWDFMSLHHSLEGSEVGLDVVLFGQASEINPAVVLCWFCFYECRCQFLQCVELASHCPDTCSSYQCRSSAHYCIKTCMRETSPAISAVGAAADTVTSERVLGLLMGLLSIVAVADGLNERPERVVI